ncbi:hypothetical protein Patl1_07762 [Pistacia atlantica]|uniref:Uncharacterized protein n=1 Tax=Pistacia atlantica TaxID=434234 RepID=A0ACC1AKP3_9ROSI|nr:hypothetical protein Patl1_07762 [Pistacia atlantica]
MDFTTGHLTSPLAPILTGMHSERYEGSGYKTAAEKGFSYIQLEYMKLDHVFLGYSCRTCDFREFSSSTEVIINFSPKVWDSFVVRSRGLRYL